MALSVFISWTSEWIVMVASSVLKAGCADACEFVCLYIVKNYMSELCFKSKKGQSSGTMLLAWGRDHGCGRAREEVPSHRPYLLV